MINLDSVLKSRDIILPTKVHIVKAMVFPVVIYGCETWTIKRAEHRRTDAFETVGLEKTLESPLDCKEIKPVNTKGSGCSADARLSPGPAVFSPWPLWGTEVALPPGNWTDWVGLAACPALSPFLASWAAGGAAVQHMASAPTRLWLREVVAGGPAPAQPSHDSGAASTSAARGAAEPGPWKRARRSGQLQSSG